MMNSRLSFYEEGNCAISIAGCHCNSGSRDLKCVVYRFVGLSLSFVFASFVVIGDPYLRAGGERTDTGEGNTKGTL